RPAENRDLLGGWRRERNWKRTFSSYRRANCCQALGGSVAQTLKMLGHQLRCAAGSPGILLSIEAKVACSVATTCAPSPTAAAPCHDQPQPRLSRWILCTVRNQRVRQNPNRNTKTPAQKAVCSAFICLLPVKADIQNFQNLNRKHPFHRFCLHFTS